MRREEAKAPGVASLARHSTAARRGFHYNRTREAGAAAQRADSLGETDEARGEETPPGDGSAEGERERERQPS